MDKSNNQKCLKKQDGTLQCKKCPKDQGGALQCKKQSEMFKHYDGKLQYNEESEMSKK